MIETRPPSNSKATTGARRRRPFITAKGRKELLTESTATTIECKSSNPSKKVLELSLFQPKKTPSDETPMPNQNLKRGSHNAH